MRVRIAIGLAFLLLHDLPAWADREAGRDVFYSAGCIACHAIECHREGPKLGGIIGRRAGSVSDYEHYSDAMKNSNVVWTEETLDAYLLNPASFIPGNGRHRLYWRSNRESSFMAMAA